MIFFHLFLVIRTNERQKHIAILKTKGLEKKLCSKSISLELNELPKIDGKIVILFAEDIHIVGHAQTVQRIE